MKKTTDVFALLRINESRNHWPSERGKNRIFDEKLFIAVSSQRIFVDLLHLIYEHEVFIHLSDAIRYASMAFALSQTFAKSFFSLGSLSMKIPADSFSGQSPLVRARKSCLLYL
jgi:hypothetical protein